MAMKQFYATRDMKHPLYRGRMLRAGEPLELDGPTARLYRRLDAITDEKPTRRVIPTVKEILTAEVAEEKPKPRRRRKTKKTA